MSSFEIGYCTLEEYAEGEEQRVLESSLVVDGMYTVMMQLRSPRFPAAKSPVKVKEITELGSGLHRVNFALLDDKRDPVLERRDTFQDGYWQKQRSLPFRMGRDIVQQAYFKEGHEELSGFDDALRDMIESTIEQDARQLVAH